jgi:hypothetical protein
LVLNVTEELPVKIARLGIEHADDAFDRCIDEVRLIEPVDMVGTDALERGNETVELRGVGRRLRPRLDNQAVRFIDPQRPRTKVIKANSAIGANRLACSFVLLSCSRSGRIAWARKLAAFICVGDSSSPSCAFK